MNTKQSLRYRNQAYVVALQSRSNLAWNGLGIENILIVGDRIQVQAIVDHHHADVKTASKVRFAEPGDEAPTDAPSPPLADSEEKDKDDKVKTHHCFLALKYWIPLMNMNYA